MDILSIFVFVIGVFSVLTNGILLIILYLDPLKKFRTTTDYLIISLTISDFITGVVACAYAFEVIAASPITFGFFWATILSSFFMIFFLSCERLVIVMYPLKVKLLITKRRVCLFITGNWLLSIVLGGLVGGLPKDRPLDYLQLSLYFVILILILILVVIYSLIIWRTKHRPNVLGESLRARSQRVIQQEKKLTGVLFLLVSVLIVTVVPYVAVMAVFAGYRIFSSPANIPNLFVTFSVYYFPVELLNFAVNPIIYAWRLPNYRNSLFFYLAKLRILEKRTPLQSRDLTPMTR